MSLGVEETGEKDAKGVKFSGCTCTYFKTNFEHLFNLRKWLLSILPGLAQLFV